MKITIPEIKDDSLKLFVNGEFKGNLNEKQANKIRVEVIEYIANTGDTSILDTFYFVGHEDSNEAPGEEIKITMDEYGNLSDLPWEMNHIRRDMCKLMKLGRKILELKNLGIIKDINK